MQRGKNFVFFSENSNFSEICAKNKIYFASTIKLVHERSGILPEFDRALFYLLEISTIYSRISYINMRIKTYLILLDNKHGNVIQFTSTGG